VSTIGVTLFLAYIQIYGMVKTIRVSEEYHEWLAAHKQDGETMEETLRRMTRASHPDDVAGLLSEAKSDEAKAAVEGLRNRDESRFEDAQSAVETE
jgi:negative regulator of replication initiation